jgi:hypothetical protein
VYAQAVPTVENVQDLLQDRFPMGRVPQVGPLTEAKVAKVLDDQGRNLDPGDDTGRDWVTGFVEEYTQNPYWPTADLELLGDTGMPC